MKPKNLAILKSENGASSHPERSINHLAATGFTRIFMHKMGTARVASTTQAITRVAHQNPIHGKSLWKSIG